MGSNTSYQQILVTSNNFSVALDLMERRQAEAKARGSLVLAQYLPGITNHDT